MNVIFDIGNVLLKWDTESIVRSVGISREHQIELKRELFEHQDWLDLDCGLVTEAEVIEKVCGRSALSPAALNQALLIAKNSLIPIPRSMELLYDIDKAGLSTYCISNMSVETYRYLRQKMDFFECFNGIVISGIERHIKPERAIFEIMLDRHKLKPSETLFIDDSAPNVAMAMNLGMSGHLFAGTDFCYSYIRKLLL